ncbi:nuclear transport factor 2 family protein [Phytohabitans sp. LJ34]|uniref:nuclear transport factor 2 family protein n=1 Tax=Phytohabitans sp. LJ34 TaxID=3452217 RepID=UPI003F897A55
MTIEDEVRAFSAVRDEALVGNDAARIAGYLTDDWVYVGPDGVTPKADIIGWIASGRLAHHSMGAVGAERVARVGDDTVVVSARKASSGTWDGVAYTADEWISEVYVRVAARWRCAFSQKSPVG